jgi:hypothetical protein
LAGFVDLLIRNANITRTKLPIWKFAHMIAAACPRLSPFLRRVILIGEAPRGEGFYLQGVSLRPAYFSGKANQAKPLS